MKLFPCSVGVALCVAFIGCGGGSTAKVTGKVTFNDKPLPGGTVIFQAPDQKAQHVPIQSDGTYTYDKAPLGEFQVGVNPPAGGNPLGSLPKGVKLPANIPADHPQAKLYQQGGEAINIPQKLRDPATSEIKVTIKGGDQNIDIPLKGT